MNGDSIPTKSGLSLRFSRIFSTIVYLNRAGTPYNAVFDRDPPLHETWTFRVEYWMFNYSKMGLAPRSTGSSIRQAPTVSGLLSAASCLRHIYPGSGIRYLISDLRPPVCGLRSPASSFPFPVSHIAHIIPNLSFP
jgi:hypothetical protein